MKTPEEMCAKWNNEIKREWKIAFFSALILGLCIHMPIMVSDIPNHDGLDSIYFDQNMITSGRWFLMVACGLSSYYSLPWLIGLLGLVFLSLTGVAITEFLELKNTPVIILVSGLLVTFPALTSTFAYVFTMDGYMLALFLAVLACLVTKKWKYGFIPGGFCLAFSLGTYQAYLAFAMLLCIYALVEIAMTPDSGKDKIKTGCRYLYMGILGVAAYYGILQVLLRIQGKQLANYQGISGLVGGSDAGGILQRVGAMYRDFLAFTLKGNVFTEGAWAVLGAVLLLLALFVAVLVLCRKKKWWKCPGFYIILLSVVVVVPLASNVMLLISPGVNYHLLMRYHWALFWILPLAFIDKHVQEKCLCWTRWAALLSALVLMIHYGVTDNIAYSNLQKKYEKTYAYCLRLLDRIEQTEGYYQGIPVAMIGVVGDEQFPATDITAPVTSGMIGISGDSLLYTGTNYQAFMKHYLGATLNFVPNEQMGEIYYSEEYTRMESFPGETSVQIVNGIVYVKTENYKR